MAAPKYALLRKKQIEGQRTKSVDIMAPLLL